MRMGKELAIGCYYKPVENRLDIPLFLGSGSSIIQGSIHNLCLLKQCEKNNNRLLKLSSKDNAVQSIDDEDCWG